MERFSRGGVIHSLNKEGFGVVPIGYASLDNKAPHNIPVSRIIYNNGEKRGTFDFFGELPDFPNLPSSLEGKSFFFHETRDGSHIPQSQRLVVRHLGTIQVYSFYRDK